ncbi:lipase [Cystobacter fuscus]|uniref:lipase n=1 Tax=Cystobacter fuscus TaxID=43 RepID=UPI0037C06FA4
MMTPSRPLAAPRHPRGVFVGLLLATLTGCATLPAVRASSEPVPVLFVPGTDDNANRLNPMLDTFVAAGWPRDRLHAVDLHPNNGQLPIEAIAYQVGRAAEALRRRTHAERVDVVAFSQGALSTRYWMQSLGGQPHVRRFVSISGPHQGTWLAYLRRDPALVQMRPDSSFLLELNRREKPFGDTEVFCFWTPLDGVIFPAENSRLPGAHERVFHVPFHPTMITHPGVISAAIEVLASPTPNDVP